MAEITERFVDSSDGVRIAVYEEGNPERPAAGAGARLARFACLWDGVVPLLADRFRIIRYDNRGVGKSSVPKPVSAYTMACYADDFAAVIDAVAPGEPVHVLAHDWGSAGMWEYLPGPGQATTSPRSPRCPVPAPITYKYFIIGSLMRPYRPRQFLRALDPVRCRFVLHGLLLDPRAGAARRARVHRRGRCDACSCCATESRRSGFTTPTPTRPMPRTA